MDDKMLNIIPNPFMIYDAECKVYEANMAVLLAFGYQNIAVKTIK